VPAPRGPIVLVGCGKMGGALLDGWLARGLPPGEVSIVEPSDTLRARAAERGVRAVASAVDLPRDLVPNAVLFAVKPQMMAEVLPAYRDLIARGPAVVSIAAGTKSARFVEAFGPATAVIRAMPNTPASIGQGASVLWANTRTSPGQRALAASLLEAVGRVHWIDDEEAMHAVTALSGSGPAYVFHLIEALTSAGVRAGLPAELAEALARATVEGAGALAAASDKPAAELRRDVTSPGGTTEAGLAVLAAPEGLAALLEKTVAVAAARSRELE
jgi:pyrroline-5-carboxylate reductase